MSRRILEGIVVSAKAHKTITVKVVRKFRHALYTKIIKRTKKYAAHDPNNHYREGDKVKIIETKPVSKTKTWAVLENRD